MTEELEQKVDGLPAEPGVYLMKDRAGRIVYVGKAINLRARVRSYFARSSSDTRAFVALLDRVLGDIETIVVRSEKEALLLENELIKRHRPRFNVRLRDDKEFLCLRLDLTKPYPRLETVRRPRRDGARYFGPYDSARALRQTLRVASRFFQLRTCTDGVLASRRRPCLLHQLGRCPAPCVLPVDPGVYRQSVDAAVLFLEGRGKHLLDELRTRMRAASARLEFEEAARLRDQCAALERSLERQRVVGPDVGAGDQDYVGLHREGERVCLYLLHVRSGRVAGGRAHVCTSGFPDVELVASFVNQYSGEEPFSAREIIVPAGAVELEGGEARQALEAVLAERAGHPVVLTPAPQRGARRELLALAEANAEKALVARRSTEAETELTLERLRQALGLPRIPRRIECFDVSHHQGRALVASRVVAIDGEPDKSQYRRYKLKTVLGNDDFASMREILSRRFARLDDEERPDLIVVDGGKGQLAAANAALSDSGAEGISLVGLAKSRDLDVGGALRGRAVPARSPERVFVLGRKDPVVLPQRSAELHVLTRLRDEAHRFAIAFQRKLARRRALTSSLEEVPGVGAARRVALLRAFGSERALRGASVEELARVSGIGEATARRLAEALRRRGDTG